ncbi:MAG TPA: acyl-CoA dehydrogenase family protein [Acidimicrobiales bacterium]
MAIDFTFPPEIEEVRLRARKFFQEEVAPVDAIRESDQEKYYKSIRPLMQRARELDLWNPHMPKEWDGQGYGPIALASISAEAGRTRLGPFVINAMAPNEGNMHTLLHWGTDEQKEKYLRPMCEAKVFSCFSMTEPEVAGSDPTLLQTKAYQDGDEWVINGHKWFSSGANRASFAIVIARTEDDPEVPQAATTAFIVPTDTPGFDIVREIETMHGPSGHSEIYLRDVRVPAENMLGGRGQGHLLGQARLGPARLAHCMRWIGQAETALEMMIDRAMNRYAHGSMLVEKQAIQWMIADSTIELYQSKLMVMHAAYLIEKGENFKPQVSMTKIHVANTLWKVIDRAIQVHGALGYSKDTPLADMMLGARSARLVDGADEVHMMQTARNAIAAYKDHGNTKAATGDLPL